MLAVAERGGRIRPRVAAVKSLASALCIGSGGSVGREGPIVQIGSALGSPSASCSACPSRGCGMLVACGAAGGISATFNAPIAGVFFALELILRDFEAESFGVVVLSSVIGRRHRPRSVRIPPVPDAARLPLNSRSGVSRSTLGLASPPPSSAPHSSASSTAWRISPTASGTAPAWLRPAAGGVLLGLLLLVLPQLYGVGYPVARARDRRRLRALSPPRCCWRASCSRPA